MLFFFNQLFYIELTLYYDQRITKSIVLRCQSQDRRLNLASAVTATQLLNPLDIILIQNVYRLAHNKSTKKPASTRKATLAFLCLAGFFKGND